MTITTTSLPGGGLTAISVVNDDASDADCGADDHHENGKSGRFSGRVAFLDGDAFRRAEIVEIAFRRRVPLAGARLGTEDAFTLAAVSVDVVFAVAIVVRHARL